jgi:uncharacterized membrane protein YccC
VLSCSRIITFALVLALIDAPLIVFTAGLVVVIVAGILVAFTAGLFPATPIFFVFVTPLALTVVHLTSPVPVPALLVDRVLETVLGSVVALVIVLLVRTRAHSKASH